MNGRAWVLGMVAAVSVAVFAKVADAKQVSGTVEQIDTVKKELSLRPSDAQSEQDRITLKWKDSLQDKAMLQSAKIGSNLTVDANESMGAWEVARVISSDADLFTGASVGSTGAHGAASTQSGAAQR